jgi:hypothetical protein
VKTGGSPIARQLARCLTAVAALGAGAAARAEGADLMSADTLSLSGDLRLVGVDGEQSWTDEGFGKLRSGSDGEWRLRPELGNFKLVWQPSLGWSLSATVVASLQGGGRTEAGLAQAYLSYKPLIGDHVRVSARAGLFWPPLSLEHEGADWHVRDTVTPSAINSWIGEEVRPAAIEASATLEAGRHQLTGTAAVFAANDTAGALLAFRGWALHDRETLAFNRQPLPPLPEAFEYYQPQFTHPLLDVRDGFADRPGYYVKLGWQPPLPFRVELFHYDNRGDPEAVNDEMEWGWRTRFDHVGAVAKLGAGTELKLQAIKGRAIMGYDDGEGIWVDSRFRSAFALVTQSIGSVHAAARLETFATRQHGSLIASESDEDGWAATLAARREFGRYLSGVLELLHVSSERDEREELGLRRRQHQTQLQADLRFRW